MPCSLRRSPARQRRAPPFDGQLGQALLPPSQLASRGRCRFLTRHRSRRRLCLPTKKPCQAVRPSTGTASVSLLLLSKSAHRPAFAGRLTLRYVVGALEVVWPPQRRRTAGRWLQQTASRACARLRCRLHLLPRRMPPHLASGSRCSRATCCGPAAAYPTACADQQEGGLGPTVAKKRPSGGYPPPPRSFDQKDINGDACPPRSRNKAETTRNNMWDMMNRSHRSKRRRDERKENKSGHWVNKRSSITASLRQEGASRLPP